MRAIKLASVMIAPVLLMFCIHGCQNPIIPIVLSDDIKIGDIEGIYTQQIKMLGKDFSAMVLIEEGEFQMGSNEGDDNETPVHTVHLDAFYIDMKEVTNNQYRRFIESTGHKPPKYWDPIWKSRLDDPQQPVVGVSWNDAAAYAEWVGKRLPTEAEWEKAARGGLANKKYPWGDEISHDNANFAGIDGKDKWNDPAPVKSFTPNGYALYDMAGNVREWCADWYDSDYYAKSPAKNPQGPKPDQDTTLFLRVIRGGGWNSHPYYLRVACRDKHYPTDISDDLGFRCAISAGDID